MVQKMTFFQPKAYFSLLIFILSVSPNACLAEQTTAAVAGFLQHAHHNDRAYPHDSPTPSHSHDKKGHEDQFCCDNELNLYVGSRKFVPQLIFHELTLSISVLIETKEPVDSNQFDTYIERLPPHLSFRARDKYAQTCLLHAPPYA